MRGEDSQTGLLFSYVSCEARVPADHPLRTIRAIIDEALDVLSDRFDTLYSSAGRPSVEGRAHAPVPQPDDVLPGLSA